VCVTSMDVSPPGPTPLYVPMSDETSPVNGPAEGGAGSTAAARSSVATVIASGSLFVREARPTDSTPGAARRSCQVFLPSSVQIGRRAES
jgi:hypothetical protein